jgi:hypothetical protein
MMSQINSESDATPIMEAPVGNRAFEAMAAGEP